jgi:hypothetical protein
MHSMRLDWIGVGTVRSTSSRFCYPPLCCRVVLRVTDTV